MATNKETLQEHENRLQEIETQLGIKLPPPRKTAKERLTEWVKANPWISLALSVILTAFSVFVGYWLNHHNEWWKGDVDARVRAVLEEKPGGVLETLKQVRDTVNRTDEKLKTLQPFIQDVIKHQFENVSKLPTGALVPRIPALENLVAVAKNQNVTVDPKIVTEVGTKLVDASRQNAEAWNAVLRWVEYKSFNNSFFSFLPDTTNEPTFTDRYVINLPPSAYPPSILLKGKAPADVAAQTGYIGQDRNKGLTFGPAWIVMEGGEVGIDALDLRNVVFHRVQISYLGGGPVWMKNVYFIDCTFKMTITPVAQNLALALLEPEPSITFQSKP